MRTVIFATPSLGHAVSLEYLRSALETQTLLHHKGHGGGWLTLGGDCFVAQARSRIVGDFLDGPGDDLFFLDDDLGWPAAKALEFVERDEDIVVGVYPKKQDTADWPVALQADEATGALIERNGLYKAMNAPTGFMRIKRHVLEKLWSLSPPFRYAAPDGKSKDYRAVFNSGPAADGQWWGEDYAFSNLALSHGFDIWVDPDIHFQHRGTKVYAASMLPALQTFRKRARQAARRAAA